MTARLTVTFALAWSSIVAFDPSFEGASWMLPAVLAAIAPMVLILGTRSFWKRPRLVALFVGILGIWYLVITLVPTTTFYGLPTGRSVVALARSGYAALATMRTTIVPIAPTIGHLCLLFASCWVGATWSALNIGRGVATVSAPWLITFGFASLIGTTQGRAGFSILFMASVLAALYVWADPETRDKVRSRGMSFRAKAGTWSGLIALVTTLILTPFFPGYGSPPLIQLGETTPGGGGRLTPFSEVRSRLDKDRTDVMFTVRSSKAAYWRLTTLETFDGRSWRLRGNFVPSDGRLHLAEPSNVPVERIEQDFQIKELRGNWLPAAHLPAEVKGVDIEVDTGRHTLQVDELSRGQRFHVTSGQPVPTLEQVRLADAGEAEALEPFLQIGSPLAFELARIAKEIAPEARSDYEQALAIQDHLRSFKYSLDVPPRHDATYIVEFLTKTQTGYCEQFAGAMALLLRSIGIPSRVAVGFLPGIPEGDTFTVTNHEAHAWTEGYFSGFGWLPFEPTPRSEAEPPPHTRTPSALTPPGSTPATSAASPPAPGEQSPDARDQDLGEIEHSSGTQGADPVDVSRRAAAIALALLTGTTLAMVAVKQTWVASLTYRATTPDARVSAAWDRLMVDAELAFRPIRPGETETEYLSALASMLQVDLKPFESIRSTILERSYGPRSVSDKQSLQTIQEGRSLRKMLWRASGWRGKARIIASPSPWIRTLRKVMPGDRDIEP